MKKIRSKKALTPIIATVLLLGMAIALFSVVQIIVFNFPFHETNPSVKLVASVNSTANTIYVQHHGGKSLSLDTEIHLIIGEDSKEPIIVKNNLDSEAKKNNVWNIGETVIIDPVDDIEGQEIQIYVVDVESNSIIMRSQLQG